MNTSKAYEMLIRRGMKEHPRLPAGIASTDGAIHSGTGASLGFTQMIHPQDVYALVLYQALIFAAEVHEDGPSKPSFDWSQRNGWIVGDEFFENGLEAVLEATKHLEPKKEGDTV